MLKKAIIILFFSFLAFNCCWAIIDDMEVKWGEAEALRREHKLKQAEELLKEVIKAKPDFSSAYISLAYIKYIQTDFEESVKLAAKVIQQGRDIVGLSNYVQALVSYAAAKGTIAHFGGLLSKISNGNAAKRSIKEAEMLQPQAPVVMYGLGNYYLLAPGIAGGDMEKAGEYLNKAIEADPLFVDAYVRLAQFYQLKGDNEKFKMYLEKALAIDPENELALDIKNGTCKFICVGK